MAQRLTQEEEEISPAKIYEFLKTKNVHNQIFEEMLSEMKDKKGFKQVKKMIEGLISKQECVLYNPDTERSVRASVINDLCAIAFTIDTIFPNVLRMKLQQEFPKLISDILEELKREKMIDNFSSHMGTEASAITIAISPDTSPATSNTAVQKSVSLAKNASPAKSSRVNGTSVMASPEKHSMPTSSNSKSQRNCRTTRSPIQTLVAPEKELEKTDIDSDNDSVFSVSSVHTSDLSSFEDAISISSSEENGKIKKTISLNEVKERLSQNAENSKNMETNSAKHRRKGLCAAPGCTNKIYSTYPGVTFHSFPKNEKRRKLWIEAMGLKDWVPLPSSKVCSKHFATEMMDYTSVSCVRLRENAVPSIFNWVTTKIKEEKSDSEEDSKLQIKILASEDNSVSPSASEPVSPQKILPQRQRKPNSRYASDNIMCPVTDKLHKRAKSIDISSNISELSSLESAHKKRKIDTLSENIEIEASKKKQETSSVDSKSASDHSKTAKAVHSSDVCKPYIAVHPLTSRRAAPVKLFSTPPQN